MYTRIYNELIEEPLYLYVFFLQMIHPPHSHFYKNMIVWLYVFGKAILETRMHERIKSKLYVHPEIQHSTHVVHYYYYFTPLNSTQPTTIYVLLQFLSALLSESQRPGILIKYCYQGAQGGIQF